MREIAGEKMETEKTIRIGTRGSELALAQTGLVTQALKQCRPELSIETVILTTKGDKILNQPLLAFGGKGAFVSEFEEALLEGRIDLAVHSAKDLPMELADGLVLAGALPRADAADVLVTRKGCMPEKTAHFTAGTGSLRRQCQLRALYPNVTCVGMRGNVPTRLRKLREGECDAVVLAAAGLKRLGLSEEPELAYRYFDPEEMVPAGGQGIIVIEGRKEDKASELAECISEQAAYRELVAEREVLRLLNAGCHEAVGVHAVCREDAIALQVMREQNGSIIRVCETAPVGQWKALAERLANRILEG